MAESHSHKKKGLPSRTAVVIRVVIVILGAILVALLIALVLQSIAIHRAHVISMRELWTTNLFKARGAPTAADIPLVRPWMTFSYVNTLFHIPSDYLKAELQIADPTYPKITIGGYAAKNGMDSNTFLQNVDIAIGQYLSMTASSTAATSSQTK
ncbi:MAG TPA: hypothetical protein VMU07_01235 [Candidatus Paceibacterota bacterium]|nr:hypothetical protein [Candidatus Paceibacterota bacterium]